MSSGISRDDWLKAIADVKQVPTDNADAVTVQEFMALMGLTKWTASKRLNELATAGKAERTYKFIRSSLGGIVKIPAYRLKTEDPQPCPITSGRGKRRSTAQT